MNVPKLAREMPYSLFVQWSAYFDWKNDKRREARMEARAKARMQEAKQRGTYR